jgi:parallel beta helix pectate lyase-like protein
MNRLRAALIAMSLITPSLLYAQLGESYVSAATGSDKHTCDFSHPCLTITRAISQTNPGGDVIILDSGPYDPFTVDKELVITAAPGIQPTIRNNGAATADAVISAGQFDSVTLRGLALSSNIVGIRFTSGKALLVESCSIQGFTNAGIRVEGPGHVLVKDTNIRNCEGFDCVAGIGIFPRSGTAAVTIDNCRLENIFGSGVLADSDFRSNPGNVRVTIRNTVSAGNQGGFVAGENNSTGTIDMNLENCAAIDNVGGVVASSVGSANITIRVSNSVITGNQEGVIAAGGAVLSRGNNTLEGNTLFNGTFSGLFVAK